MLASRSRSPEKDRQPRRQVRRREELRRLCAHSEYVRDRRLAYFPANAGLRFWLYAPSPSFASSLWKSCCCSSRSIASALSSGTSHPLCTERLMRPTAFAALFGGQKLQAYSITRSHHFLPSCSAGQT